MISKQLSWRRSNQALILFLSCNVSTSLFSMEYLYGLYANWKNHVHSIEHNDDTLDEYSMLVPGMTEEQKSSYVARGKTWKELVEVFQDSPEDMQDIVDHLISPADPEWRAAFLVGPTGTGKSTAALAVPHLARWYWRFLSGPELAGQYRNEAKERLAAELIRAVRSKKKVVVIVDELNRLLENFDSKGHDSDTTGSFLWTFLDEQKRNPNFFFIGTMNREDKIPDPIKHRLGGSTITFPPMDSDKMLDIFKKVIARNPEIAFDDECDDVFFQKCFKSLEEEGISITPRDYENIRFQIARLTRRDDRASAVRKIKRHHVVKAMQAVAKAYDCSGLGRERLSDEEWRDFNAVQAKVIEIKLNATQLSQANYGITGIIPTFTAGSGVRFDVDKAEAVIAQEFSKDQIALYRRVMQLKPGESLFKRAVKTKRA